MNDEEKRLQLQEVFKTIIHNENVYFQPPETIKLNYPCIIYFKSSLPVQYANDIVYKYKQCYSVTVVDKDPDSIIANKLINSLNYCTIDSYYRSENLNHTKLTLYY